MVIFSCNCGAIKKDQPSLNDVMKDIICPKCKSKLRDTSISKQAKLDSYLSLDENELSKMRQLIYNELMSNPGTDSEIAKRLGFSDPNKVRPRRFELKDLGLIKADHKHKCDVTGKKATVWVIT